MLQTMNDSTSLVVDAINNTITRPFDATPASQYTSALRCLQAWMSYLKAK